MQKTNIWIPKGKERWEELATQSCIQGPLFNEHESEQTPGESKLREDRGSWHAAVHGMGKSQTQLSNRTTTTTKWNILLILLDFPCGLAGKESICNAGDLGLIPGLGRSPGERKGYPLLYSGLDHSVDCVVHGVAMSWTLLSIFHSLTH